MKKEAIHEVLQEMEYDGDRWHKDGITGPSSSVLRDTSRILECLWDACGILPEHLKQTVEEGIYADFKQHGKLVLMEIYNDGNAAVLLQEDGKIVESIDIPRSDRVRITCQTIQQVLKS